jgi:putative flippase GtrA
MAAHVTTIEEPPTSPPAGGEVSEMGRVQRLVRFVAVGGVGFVVGTLLLAVFVDRGLPNFLASLLATECAIINNYVLHEVFTFGTRRLTLRRLGTYNLAAALGLVITAVAFDGISRVVDWPLVVRNLLAVGCGTTSNFLLSSRFVWGTRAGVVDD